MLLCLPSPKLWSQGGSGGLNSIRSRRCSTSSLLGTDCGPNKKCKSQFFYSYSLPGVRWGALPHHTNVFTSLCLLSILSRHITTATHTQHKLSMVLSDFIFVVRMRHYILLFINTACVYTHIFRGNTGDTVPPLILHFLAHNSSTAIIRSVIIQSSDSQSSSF